MRAASATHPATIAATPTTSSARVRGVRQSDTREVGLAEAVCGLLMSVS